MPPWSLSAFGAAVFIAAHYLLLRGASAHIDDRLGALVLEGSAAVGIAVTFAFSRTLEMPPARLGVALASASGLAVAVASVLLFATLRRGGPVASTGTIVLGGGVALSALLAPFFFGESESLSPRRAIGVALGLAAMWVLGGQA
jgi:hypothetical protein